MPKQMWADIALRLPRQFDAILIRCAGIHVSVVIQTIEDDVGCPVITSNAALPGYCLKTLNTSASPGGFGALSG